MRRRERGWAALLAGGLALALTAAGAGAGPAAAAFPPGVADTSFGAGGLAQTPFGAGARAAALALGPGGSITVAGDVRGSAGEAALVARFTSAGALDPSFASAGSRLDRFGAGVGAGSEQRARAVAVAPDGSTIVAGVAGAQIMVARYLPSGELDGLFGAGGVVLRDLSEGAGMPRGQRPGRDRAPAERTDPRRRQHRRAGGRSLRGGRAGRADRRRAPQRPRRSRLGFGLGGFFAFQLGARSARGPARSHIAALAPGPGGTIVLAGRSSGPDGRDRAIVARLTEAGGLDSRFGRAGRRVVQLGYASAARPAQSALHALAVRPDGSAARRRPGHGRRRQRSGRAGAPHDRRRARRRLRPRRRRPHAGRKHDQGPPAAVGRARDRAHRERRPAGHRVQLAGRRIHDAHRASGRLDCGYGSLGTGSSFGPTSLRPGDPATDGAFGVVAQPDGHYLAAGRLPGGGVLLGRVTGGPSGAPQPPAGRPAGLRTLGARYLGQGRAVVYGAVAANCAAATVRFVASPATRRGGGRTVATRYARIAGAYGIQVVCARISGLRPGLAYKVRIDSRQMRGAVGGTRTLRAVAAARKALPQEGCA